MLDQFDQLINLINLINSCVEVTVYCSNCLTVTVCSDSAEVCETVSHRIIIEKLLMYRMDKQMMETG